MESLCPIMCTHIRLPASWEATLWLLLPTVNNLGLLLMTCSWDGFKDSSSEGEATRSRDWRGRQRAQSPTASVRSVSVSPVIGWRAGWEGGRGPGGEGGARCHMVRGDRVPSRSQWRIKVWEFTRVGFVLWAFKFLDIVLLFLKMWMITVVVIVRHYYLLVLVLLTNIHWMCTRIALSALHILPYLSLEQPVKYYQPHFTEEPELRRELQELACKWVSLC